MEAFLHQCQWQRLGEVKFIVLEEDRMGKLIYVSAGLLNQLQTAQMFQLRSETSIKLFLALYVFEKVYLGLKDLNYLE